MEYTAQHIYIGCNNRSLLTHILDYKSVLVLKNRVQHTVKE